ncbi:hypothetical protein E2C01_096852 [Portunus trituberculatus]|uniref:Uncharacterized protein n=1 Tax=Portunus trituberculatus TaxID=210409 RepID=A0A5B7JTL3_PORTR|nr:hypothetical protein [Portunus trituberculatus]
MSMEDGGRSGEGRGEEGVKGRSSAPDEPPITEAMVNSSTHTTPTPSKPVCLIFPSCSPPSCLPPSPHPHLFILTVTPHKLHTSPITT